MVRAQEVNEVNIDIWAILDTALNWFFGITLAVAVIMLIYAGFTYITSGGNETKLQTASKILIFALIGVAIALLAKGLPVFIQNFLEGKESSSSSTNNINENNIAANNLIEQAYKDKPNLSTVNAGYKLSDPACLSDSEVPIEECCSWNPDSSPSDPECGKGLYGDFP